MNDPQGEDGRVSGFLRLHEQHLVESAAALVQRCAFPVLVPDYWPESCGEMVFGFVSSPPDTSYFVRSLRHDTYLSITGQAWHEVGVASEEGMKPLEGMPWPSLLRRTRPGAVVLVKAPETCVHVTGVLPVNELLAVAMSLQEVQPPSSVK